MRKRKAINRQKKEVNYIVEDEKMVGGMENYKTGKEVWGWRWISVLNTKLREDLIERVTFEKHLTR